MGTQSPIRQAREARRLTKTALARLAGVSYDTVRRAEAGIPVNWLSQALLADALEVPVLYLFPRQESA